ncbi:hypothetical protein FH966_10470 [Lentibacillus cibarius]|uniref:DUF1648 domain-containing protein n=1 Tax=Lentibacillus cibarius TaxID=2583219 RepID=A0A549YJM9_9BACI|nr:hypothetical protein [Lentibacillus cibarius]TMN23285.1 hypothetical protein FFL34_15200 [Lentibacillus cibarius]TRM12072.1 hypothetical protein FH966_10470 [Lentibacillus cibarius]
MNDKLWKSIQFSSMILFLGVFIGVILVSDLEPKPDGGWHATFPSKTVQLTALGLSIVLFLTWVFATYVRREGEVSLRAAKRGVLFIIGMGIFYWLLQQI